MEGGDPTSGLAMKPALNPELEGMLASDPLVQLRPAIDNNFIMIQYYKEKLFGLLSKEQIDPVFVFAVETIINQHRGQIAMALAQQTSIQTIAGATEGAVNNAPQLRDEAEDHADNETKDAYQ